MLRLDLQNVTNIDAAHGITPEEILAEDTNLGVHLKAVKSRGQGFYNIVNDTQGVEKILMFAKKVSGKFDDIIVLGIGGSALGTLTLREALTPLFSQKCPRLHVLENIDPDLIAESADSFDLNKTLFLVVSKSGGTPETLAQYSFFRDKLEKAQLPIAEHMVFITDPTEGLLRSIAQREGLTAFPIPPNVGGRFSVLTAVGLLPAALIGIDIQALLKGAQRMRERFLSENPKANLPFQLSVVQYLCSKKGKTQNVLMPYATKLRSFAAWFTQLLAESTGKINAQERNVGLTPVPALGVTDQHSQLQLFAQGPNDKLIVFLAVETFAADPSIPVTTDHEKIAFLKNKTFRELLHAEQSATANTLAEANRPNITLHIDRINAERLGELFMLFEGATAFLGEFLDIDAFDQPGVERSKVLTREYLS